jgi:hypothetical protein
MADTYLAPDGKRYAADVERTPEGLLLTLGGVKPQSMKDKLDWLIAQPMQPRKHRKSQATRNVLSFIAPSGTAGAR